MLVGRVFDHGEIVGSSLFNLFIVLEKYFIFVMQVCTE